MVNEGWPEDQAERLAKRALPTLSEKELRDEFLVGLADGFSPRQAAANAREPVPSILLGVASAQLFLNSYRSTIRHVV